ncbi:FadR/GntR family transcriptional regulator [Spirochaeta isovalerica]|uniref:DNA-binding FadR family transcriptional regulator n=1 Tax=Spirochaeta isovalerica TaxID=150 RepID=A0A841RBQ1_9SPIO|nr:GntR family transcriptional regulator [Spirochaeta isovalerica]MBB6480440.1 DNA-binding FadR family transcriptional regulator [Spirochaeta isovalerica]
MKRLKEDIVQELEFRILSEKYDPGERLPPERDLAAEFAVSRPVIHEALLILEGRGLVTMRPRHGVVVNDFRQEGTLDLLTTLLLHTEEENLNPHVLSSLYRVRALMESDAAVLACNAGKTADWDLLEEIMSFDHHLSNPSELALRDFRIHQQIALISGNIVYPLLINSLRPVYLEYLKNFYGKKGDSREIRDLQRDLLVCFRQSDGEKAGKIMKKLSSYTLE